MSKVKLALIALPIFFVAFIMNAVSLVYQTTYSAVTGNVGGLQYTDLPRAGFPFPYVYDSPATSVMGSLGPSDEVRVLAFLGNQLIYMGIIVSLLFSISKFRRNE